MYTKLKKATTIPEKENIVILVSDGASLDFKGLSKDELAYAHKQFKDEKNLVAINRYDRWVFIQQLKAKDKEKYFSIEKSRKAGNDLLMLINKNKISEITIVNLSVSSEETLAFAEGMALGNYQFLKYKKDAKKDANSLKTILLYDKKITSASLDELQSIVDAVCNARDLVNEPVNSLNATGLAKEFQRLGKEAGFKVEVFDKKKIETLKMGGLLAVNKGSVDPPTFTVMEWKPKNAKNKKPYVLVGKGVVYDTGGLSLKPTLNSMDSMKCDMAGGAAVGCAMYAIAKNKLPLHVIALVPATDNRPGGNAYTPGDVIKMHSGLTVEMLNADAEGRMILADALSYAKQYKPELVMDFATLTGAAVAAIGSVGTVCMGTADEKTKDKIKTAANNVYERVAELPFWDEYDEMIKSDIADMKNVGGSYAGAITAGKFLQRYIDYPWMHFDIAGPAFLKGGDGYRPKNGTGTAVRFLFEFLKGEAK